MIRAGISLPALMQLMGHAQIQTTLVYVQLTPQDVWEQYARAVAQHHPARSATTAMKRQRTPAPHASSDEILSASGRIGDDFAG